MNRWIFPFALALMAGCSSPDSSPRTEPQKVDVGVDRAAVRARLAAHRTLEIERLHAYGEANAFPHNTRAGSDLHMFEDGEGRLCAVANLVHQDGRDDLVELTVREKNDLAIADVHEGAMYEWMLGSGLTQEELVRIQLPAPPLMPARREVVAPPKPIRVARVEAANAITEERMNAIVRAHVIAVEAELRASTDASLEIAVDRWIAYEAKLRRI